MSTTKHAVYTKEMHEEGYTILIPNMAEIHFELVRNVFELYGHKTVLLTNSGPSVVQEGLKYVHNDTCYPALLVIGQMMDALHSGKYDLHKVALIITQTGGGCRASNYIHLLRKALKKAGLEYIPVISLNLSGLESSSGFKLTIPMLRRAIAALVYGDCLMHLANQTRPYENKKGETDALIQKWIGELTDQFAKGRGMRSGPMRQNLERIADEFDAIEREHEKKTRVGIVGEIYVKYASLGNNNLEAFLREQDCEYMVPGIMGFALFKTDNRLEDIKLYGGNPLKYAVCSILKRFLTHMETILIETIKKHPSFVPPSSFEHTKSLVKDVIGYGSKMGEGWLLTAEMIELTENGYANIVCTQPFGCLPNHICGKGMIRKIRELYPNANIVPIDYDPSATRVNQENRIRLMLCVARGEQESGENVQPAIASGGLGD